MRLLGLWLNLGSQTDLTGRLRGRNRSGAVDLRGAYSWHVALEASIGP